jgi:serine protease Do
MGGGKSFRFWIVYLFLLIGWGIRTAAMAGEAILLHREPLNLSFAPVVKKVAPAVVNIYATRVLKSSPYSPFFDDPIFRHFFGDQFQFGVPHTQIQSSLGSGVIVRSDGVVVTNYHVIKHAEEVKVILQDGREFEGEVIVRDKRTDLAVLKLKVNGEKLPFLEFRDADQLEVGDIILAFGNPFGFGNTVTSGIVSGLARSQVGVADFRSLIQTDAAINPGNSGGPLVTLDGRIVGINTAIFSNTGGSIGIGFAIPSNLVIPVVNAVDHGGTIVRAWVGIQMESLDSDMARTLGLQKPQGVLIKKIYPKSPAEKAGLRVGDVILKIDGHEIINEANFRFRIATFNVGKMVGIEVWRQGDIHRLQMKLESPPDIAGNKKVNITGRNPLAGAVVTGLSPAVANDLGIAYEEGSVVVISIRSGTPAALTGLLPGDVITSINDHSVRTVDDLVLHLNRSRSGWEINFIRQGKENKIIVRNW